MDLLLDVGHYHFLEALLQTMLLRTFVYQAMCGCMFWVVLGTCLGAELLAEVATPCLSH